MVTLLPLDGSFIRYAGRFVDEAWGVAAGYNYFVAQSGWVCFELTIFKTVIGYVSALPLRDSPSTDSKKPKHSGSQTSILRSRYPPCWHYTSS